MNKQTILAALLAVCMLLCLCACGSDEPAAAGDATAAPTEAPTAAPTAAPTESDDGKVTYTVTVLGGAGNPIVGAMVQLCLDACIPAPTDAAGVATWTLVEADYKVSFVVPPEGYAVEEAYYFEAGTTALTITLEAA